MSRGGGPVASNASRSSAVPSMEASLNAQIQDLVQRNRTLEHTNKKLTDEVAIDADRAKRALRDAQTKLNEERAVWREGCNRLISLHHLAHLRLSAKFSNAEAALLKEMELSRQEKVARLHRDFQITMFRIREGELELKIEGLEDSLQEGRRGQDSHFSELQERIKTQEEEICTLTEERAASEVITCSMYLLDRVLTGTQKELVKLRETYGRLQVKAESIGAKLERLNLQFDGSQTTNAELERQNDELKRANVDIKRQLDKWQNLETKGGEEVETLRKQRIELEVEVKALETRLEKKNGELQKEKSKVAKHKQNVDEFQVYIQEQREELKDVTNQLSKARKQVERLQAELDAERAARPISPLKRLASPTVSEDEVADDIAQDPPPSSPAKPVSKKPRSKASAAAPSQAGRKKPAAESVAGPSNALDGDSEIEEVPDPKARSRAKAKTAGTEAKSSKNVRAKPRSRTAGRESSASGDDARGTTNKGKGKAVEVVDDSESDVAPRPKTAARGKRKRDDSAAGPSKRGTSELPEVVERPKPRPRKVASGGRAGSVQPRGTAVVSDEESDAPARKKKKRTIGLFPASSQPASFNFLPMGDTGGGINIPSVLSPVRESDVVPSRSSAPSRTGSTSSVMGSIGGLLSSFGRRKQ
ncbi:hypothetical protein C8R47DRAFT_974727 [Mycena vitilis]|nr:hypothetical protein C8R47DRAFT_974727 [Mycena vitilis]